MFNAVLVWLMACVEEEEEDLELVYFCTCTVHYSIYCVSMCICVYGSIIYAYMLYGFFPLSIVELCLLGTVTLINK